MNIYLLLSEQPALLIHQDYYAIGSGANIGGSHWKALDITSTYGSQCQGSYQMSDTTSSGITADIDFSCSTSTGNVTAPFDFIVNGRGLPACNVIVLAYMDGSSVSTVICGTNVNQVSQCAHTAAGTMHANTVSVDVIERLAFKPDGLA